MDQISAQQALEPFIALAKSATSPRAAADLVTQATSAPNTSLFAELLAQQNVAKLKDDQQYGGYHGLLEIFAWGTWETYQNTPQLPQLSEQQTLKLRLLSLISYASERQGDLSYATLCSRLGFSTSTDLEHLVTAAIYSDLITATLDPAEQKVQIRSVAPLRDLVPGSIAGMLMSLETWSKRCDGVIADLEAEIAKIKADATQRATQQWKVDKQYKAALEGSNDRKGALGQGYGVAQNTRGSRGSNKREAILQSQDDVDDDMEVDAQHTGAAPRKKSGGIMDRLKPK